MWSDLNGLSHGRYVPVRRIHEHTHHAVTTLTMSPLGEILEVPGYSSDVGFPDLSTVPSTDSRRPGWEPETDIVIAGLEYQGKPLALCPRGALQRAIDAWRALGYEPMLGFEMEFYVMRRDEAAPGGHSPLDRPNHRVYGVGMGGDVYAADGTSLMFEFFDNAEACELDLEGVCAEFSPGQMELNMKYGPAMDAADRAFTSREMVREIAHRHGFGATFMGRPISGPFTGSGLHINFSLVPVNGGPNAFDDHNAEHGISELARQCLGGMLAHHEGMSLLSAPTVNSYKRLIPGIIAGYWANWGLDNRMSTYRIPGERGAATRIENRMPCGRPPCSTPRSPPGCRRSNTASRLTFSARSSRCSTSWKVRPSSTTTSSGSAMTCCSWVPSTSTAHRSTAPTAAPTSSRSHSLVSRDRDRLEALRRTRCVR